LQTGPSVGQGFDHPMLQRGFESRGLVEFDPVRKTMRAYRGGRALVRQGLADGVQLARNVPAPSDLGQYFGWMGIAAFGGFVLERFLLYMQGGGPPRPRRGGRYR